MWSRNKKNLRRNKMKRALIALLVLVFAFSAMAEDKKWPKELKFGAIPVASQASMNDTFGYLAGHLSKSLNMKVELKKSSDYAAVIAGMQFGHIDCAYFGPKSYVEAARRAKAEALVIEVGQDGSKGYKGTIITKADSGLKSIESLKGKTWAFTDPNSTSGTLVPSVHFSKIGINPTEYFSKVIYSGGHEASILSVKNGKVDAASTNDLDFARGEGRHWEKSDFNIIWVSDLIPGAPIACRSDLPESLKQAVKESLLNFKDPKGLDALKVSGYAPADDKMYDPIRELIVAKKKLKK